MHSFPCQRCLARAAIVAIWSLVLGAGTAWAEDEFERPPIAYSQARPENVVSQLQHRLARGETKWTFDQRHGYLPALLKTLQIPVESQMLVFSKTSFQRDRISPRTPRAVYFNDEVYVGYCQGGDVLEISVADAALGAVFYTLDQQEVGKPNIVRQTGQCLQCHTTRLSNEIPGHLVRSVYPDAAGAPVLSEGSTYVDHTTPFKDRWGGWYVTGKHGDQTHLGNFNIREMPLQRPVLNPAGQNVVDLSGHMKTARYLAPHSDIVALMVLEHQALVHNLITQANFTTRQALHYEAALNRELGKPAGHRWDSTTSRIASAGDALVEGLLFAGEARLTEPIEGTSTFANQFTQAGPRDRRGRSLREFDLKTRMFKYPCSYLIYSTAFDGLPGEMKQYVAGRLREVLTASERQAEEASEDPLAHLTAADRRAIWEILNETNPELFAR